MMHRSLLSVLAILLFCAPLEAKEEMTDADRARKEEYVTTVTRGGGMLPWQSHFPSEEERAFREAMEERKDRMLRQAVSLSRPVTITPGQIERGRNNIESNDWARAWFERQKERADYVLDQPSGYVEDMISLLTPWHVYGFTCPNCVGEKSQEGTGGEIADWDYRDPDVITCKVCGHRYPSEQYPETVTLVCPRMGQEFSFYRNPRQREYPEDYSGERAYKWVGRPMHMSFSGIVRMKKAQFMLGSLSSLAYLYAFTEDPRYAEKTVEILLRFTEAYRGWLYHDYWDTVADCDPLFASWHDRGMRLEFKRHLTEKAFAEDTLEKATTLMNYWGAGRYYPTTDVVSVLSGICMAFDLVSDARNAEGEPLWTEEMRDRVKKDLILEWVIGAEPFVGGEGEARETNNKAPRVYNAQGAVAKCLGIAPLADVALRGYEGIRDEAFLFDGFSRESPGYTGMYLGEMIQIPETLHGFTWPEGFPGRSGTVNLYETDRRLELMYRAAIDTLRPDGRYLPLSDTGTDGRPGRFILELGLNRYPEYFRGYSPRISRHGSPGTYSLLNLSEESYEAEGSVTLPELFWPAWMTAIFRHGKGSEATILTLAANPIGGHRHSDNLAVFYSDSGQTILGDHGYVNDMPVNSWIHSTYSHNLVIVNDRGQRFWGNETERRRPELALLYSSPRVSVVEASSAVYLDAHEYRRLVALIKGPEARTFALDIFRVKGGNKHDYRLFSELAASDGPEGRIEFSGLTMPGEPPLPQVAGSMAREDIFGLRDIRRDENPPDTWQAVWAQKDRGYRLHFLSPVDRVEASNGPGQQIRGSQLGRRLRYLDAIREGENIVSTFVAVHEPSEPGGAMPIRSVRRIAVPEAAGPDAVAVGIDSEWGDYLLLSDFTGLAEVEGVRFRGKFGLIRREEEGRLEWLSIGAETCEGPGFGFSGKTAVWEGPVLSYSDESLVTEVPRPEDWPEDWSEERPEEQRVVLIEGWDHPTGLPVHETGENTIRVKRFPIPAARRFRMDAVRGGE